MIRTIRPPLLALALALLALAVYAPVATHDFVVYDDDLYITTVEPIREGLSLRNFAWAWLSIEHANWFPLTRLSWLVDSTLFGVDPRGFHTTNALLHALATAGFFLAFVRLSGSRWRSAAVAAVFAVHPLHVESVAWAAARKDVLSGLFAALALLAYASFARGGGTGRLGWVGLWLACGLLAKPTLVVWPFVLLLLDGWPLGRLDVGTLRARIVEKWPLFALVAAFSGITFWTQSASNAVRDLESLGVGTRLANAAASFSEYTRDVFWPRDLAVFYPHPGASLESGPVVAGVAILAAGFALAWALRRSAPFVAVGWLWYVGSLLPVIGLVQVGQAARADRYTYLPLIGLSLAVVWGAHAVTSSPRARRALAAGALIGIAGLSVATRHQLATWRDSESLFRHALRVTERNHVAHINLGMVLSREGELDAAASHLLAALRIKPASSIANGLLGSVRLAQGRSREARALYERANVLAPEDTRWQEGLARTADFAR